MLYSRLSQIFHQQYFQIIQIRFPYRMLLVASIEMAIFETKIIRDINFLLSSFYYKQIFLVYVLSFSMFYVA